MFLVRKFGGSSATSDHVPISSARDESEPVPSPLNPSSSSIASANLQPVLDATQLISTTHSSEALVIYPVEGKKSKHLAGRDQPWHRRLSVALWGVGASAVSDPDHTPSVLHSDDIIALSHEDNDDDLTLVSLRRLSYAEAATLGLSRPRTRSRSPVSPPIPSDAAAPAAAPTCTPTQKASNESAPDVDWDSETDEETKAGFSLNIRKRKVINKFKKGL